MGDVEHSFEPTERRVRVRFGRLEIARSHGALLLMGGSEPPLYELSSDSFPRADASTDMPEPRTVRTRCETATTSASRDAGSRPRLITHERTRQCDDWTTMRSAPS
jgi:uncharacterized protein (DUF427 family)